MVSSPICSEDDLVCDTRYNSAKYECGGSQGHLDLLLLAALDARPAHGYAIVETLRQESNGTFDLPEGTIYPALHRLERARLLESRWSEDSGRRRRVYQFTAKGQRELSKRRHEWKQFARALNAMVCTLWSHGNWKRI